MRPCGHAAMRLRRQSTATSNCFRFDSDGAEADTDESSASSTFDILQVSSRSLSLSFFLMGTAKATPVVHLKPPLRLGEQTIEMNLSHQLKKKEREICSFFSFDFELLRR